MKFKITLIFLIIFGVSLVTALNWIPPGDIDMADFFDIVNGKNASFVNLEALGNITIGENLFMEDGVIYLDSLKEHTFSLGCSDVIGDLGSDSFCFWNKEIHPTGTIAHQIIEGSDITNLRLIDITQVGKNNSVSFRGNSQFIGPNTICQNSEFNDGSVCNLTKVTDIFELYDFFNKTPSFAADTSGYGATLFVQGGLDVWRRIVIREGLVGFGEFSWTGIGDTADFFNTSIHPQKQVTFESGFSEGDSRIALDVPFIGSISPFTNLDVSPDVWFVTTSSLCDDNACAEATGNSGSVDITMTTNTTTLNLNNTDLSFTYSLVGLVGSDNFRVETNNFTGTGWEVQLTDAGTENVLSSTISLGSDYWNVSTVGIRVVCDVTKALRNCYIDNVVLNGTQTLATNENVTGIFSQICFGDSEPDSVTGICSRGIYYDPSEDKTFIAGPFNVTSGSGSGSGISGTANRIAKITGDGTTAGNSIMTDNSTDVTVDGGVFANLFSGVYDWVIGDGSDYLIFNGTDLDLNVTKLNEDFNQTSKITDGFFINYTSVKTSGNISNGTMTGYPYANVLCDAEMTGSHMCTMGEILNSINQGIANTNFTATFRVSEGAPGFTAEANDCAGWSSPTGSALGSIWVGSTSHINTYGTGSLTACNAERAIGCCG